MYILYVGHREAQKTDDDDDDDDTCASSFFTSVHQFKNRSPASLDSLRFRSHYGCPKLSCCGSFVVLRFRSFCSVFDVGGVLLLFFSFVFVIFLFFVGIPFGFLGGCVARAHLAPRAERTGVNKLFVYVHIVDLPFLSLFTPCFSIGEAQTVARIAPCFILSFKLKIKIKIDRNFRYTPKLHT